MAPPWQWSVSCRTICAAQPVPAVRTSALRHGNSPCAVFIMIIISSVGFEKPTGKENVAADDMTSAATWHVLTKKMQGLESEVCLMWGSNLSDYMLCVLILPCLYLAGDMGHSL